jgi:dipeptidyl aminopeptidase/acylaminoacyl peptidase
MSWNWTVIACLLAALPPGAAQQFTIEQILGAPFPTGLIAAPTGARLAWVFNERGARNLWIADGPQYQGRRLTNYRQDDGEEITNLRWSPGARYIAFVRGEGTNSRGEYANPTSDPKGVTQSVCIMAADGGEPRIIGEGHDPAIAGDRIYFVRAGQIWSAALEGAGQAAQLVHARGQASGLVLSPDGAHLAFVSERGDHSFIGVYDIASAALRYLDPSVDRDIHPAWSPDSRRIAFIRLAAAQFVPGPRRNAQPWSIRVAFAATGQGHEVWRAQPGAGSAFRTLAGDDNLFWMAGDRLIFPWERDGWLHLYAIAAEGGKPVLLTRGAFEVEDVTQAPGAREVVFSSNQGDIDRRHIWRVNVDGGVPSPVTGGDGIETQPAVAGDGTIAFLRSDARLPLRPAIRAAAGNRDIAPESLPAGFPRSALVEPRQVVFPSTDGLEIHGQLFLPKPGGPDAPAKSPAMIFFHGGSRRQMLLGWHYMYYYSNAYALNQYFASRGYIVLSVNYRSGIGYGLDFREALHYGPAGASEFNDVLASGLFLRARADVDALRIGLWGGSYGGYLTALGLARASGQFAAGVDFHGVHDWSKLLGALPPEAARLAFESSPMASVKDWHSPVLLIHGDDDRNVSFSQTVDLVRQLRLQQVDFEELIFPDEIHDFLTHRHWVTAYQAAADFFERKLRNPPRSNGKLE